MLIFESCLFKSHAIFGRAYFQNIWVSLLLKYYLTVILVNCLVLQETWREKNNFKNPNSTFNKAFLGTPSAKRAHKKYQATFLSTILTMLIFSSSSFWSCLFSRLAYFRTSTYFRESTVREKSDVIMCAPFNVPKCLPLLSLNVPGCP